MDFLIVLLKVHFKHKARRGQARFSYWFFLGALYNIRPGRDHEPRRDLLIVFQRKL